MEAPQITPRPEEDSQRKGKASPSYIEVDGGDVKTGGGGAHTPAKGPSVTGSTGLALGMCVGDLARPRG